MKRTAMLLLSVVVLGVAACAPDEESSDAGASATTVAQGIASTDGFAAPLVGGGSVALADLLANKPVALWFWAPG